MGIVANNHSPSRFQFGIKTAFLTIKISHALAFTPAVSATGASAASSSPAQTTVTTGPVNTGFDFCALSSPKLIDAFTIGNTIYFGEKGKLYSARMSAQGWHYNNEMTSKQLFPGSDGFDRIVSAVYFGSQQECDQLKIKYTHVDCTNIAAAFDKVLLFGPLKGSYGAHFLYKGYTTVGAPGGDIIVAPISDPKDMPWGLPVEGPLDGPFWPSGTNNSYFCAAYHPINRFLFLNKFESQKPGFPGKYPLYLRKIDDQVTNNYTYLEPPHQYSALIYANDNLFGVHSSSDWHLLDVSDKNKTHLVGHSQPTNWKEFLNCGLKSPLFDPMFTTHSPATTLATTSATNTSVSNGGQTPSSAANDTTLSTGDTSADTSGTVGSTNTSSVTTPSPTKKSSNTTFWIILIVVIVIVIIIAIVCVIFCCFKSKTPPKSADKKSEKSGPKSKVEPSGGAKGKGDKKSDETVRSGL
ncbi:unnamed protein product [Medioppia subpectinata]|uniref:Uncharacterized protein n=1 Tax=Medioppia subpectinata TaxID=1979941 RepID=A0A7R9L197_9ACAR|nr:unnamed protein product [Medioppia subpectinata]CAG2113473.1 unnamed protein product [Medioppia subpectinata]